MKRLFSALCLVAAVLTTGCSSFDREWRNIPPQSSTIAGLAGHWEGRWLSASGHQGKLRAVITPLAEAIPSQRREQLYAARFHATFARVLSGGYTVRLRVQQRGARSDFQGTADLGRWGKYDTAGHATATQFHATYHSKLDHGTFEMQRRSKASSVR